MGSGSYQDSSQKLQSILNIKCNRYMSDDLKDILSNLNKEIEQEKLLEYLNKNLSAAEAHEVEKQMANDEFMNDAVEGLEKFKNYH